MNTTHASSRTTRFGLPAAGALALALSATGCATAKAGTPSPNVSVVLVHGALTGASVWDDVSHDLQARGYAVSAPAMPLRGLASDAAYLAAYLKTVHGPVILVGHSWAGQVITQAASSDPDVKALVYVAAFQPDDGETAGALNAQFPGSKLVPENLDVFDCPGGKDLYLKRASFREVYANDVPPEKAEVMAAEQRPIDPSALGEKLQGHAAWHTIPSWALVSTNDFSIPTAALRFMAQRAHSQVEEVNSSHAVPVAHPDAVVKIIVDAASATATH